MTDPFLVEFVSVLAVRFLWFLPFLDFLLVLQYVASLPLHFVQLRSHPHRQCVV